MEVEAEVEAEIEAEVELKLQLWRRFGLWAMNLAAATTTTTTILPRGFVAARLSLN